MRENSVKDHICDVCETIASVKESEREQKVITKKIMRLGILNAKRYPIEKQIRSEREASQVIGRSTISANPLCTKRKKKVTS